MTTGDDPYRYGRPAQPVQSVQYGSRPTGKEVVGASIALLRQDKQLIWLPVISTGGGLLAAAVLFFPGFLIGRSIGHTDQVGGYVGGVLAALALSIVSIYFQAAMVIGAFWRADGHRPTVGAVLQATWQRRWQVLGWAVLTTTVGTALRAVEERLGVFGKILGFIVGIGWAIASFFVIPVIVAEGLGPAAGVKRSTRLIRETWGSSVRTSVRLGIGYLLLFVPILIVFFIGLGVAVTGGVVPGVLVMAIAVLAVIVLASVFSAVTTYARALIYRYAVGQPVPGISPGLLAGAFTTKRRGWRRR